MSCHGSAASPHTSEAMVNRAMPAMKVRRLPIRSPIADAVSSNDANASV
jgi:hypothetical protein